MPCDQFNGTDVQQPANGRTVHSFVLARCSGLEFARLFLRKEKTTVLPTTDDLGVCPSRDTHSILGACQAKDPSHFLCTKEVTHIAFGKRR
jgi:hypothetical protein